MGFDDDLFDFLDNITKKKTGGESFSNKNA
jgi:hypothetical protein